MGRILMALVAIVCVTAVAQAAPTYVVEIGSAGEAAYSPVGWGPVEPTTSGGSWGGIATDPLSNDGLCRVVWEPNGDWMASVTFPTLIYSADIRHLDGIAINDSFSVWVDGEFWGAYNDDNSTASEIWQTTSFSGDPGSLMVIMSGAYPTEWSLHGTYGTLAIDRIDAYVPAPGALLLGGIGTAVVGWMRRRRAM